jgi:HEAT repeat protein
VAGVPLGQCVERLNDLDPATRLEAVGHLTTAATEGDEALRRRLQIAMPGLRGLLRDKHEPIRLAAARALMTIDAGKESSVALPVLLGGLDSEEDTETAVAALAVLGAREVVVREALAAALVSKKRSTAGRFQAAEALLRVGRKDRATVKALTEAALDSDARVASAAAKALDKFDPGARMRVEVALFHQGLRSRDAGARREAVDRLGSYAWQGGKGREAAALKEADRALFAALDDRAPTVRHWAMEFIHTFRVAFRAQLGPDTGSIARALKRAANDPDFTVRRTARQILALEGL